MRTGSDYLQSLKERKSATFVGGEQVNDVTAHPAFANAVSTVAKLYDVSSNPANAEKLTFKAEDGKRYNNMWLLPRQRQDIDGRNRLHTAWAEVTWGLLGRSPDHVAGWVSGMACCPEILDVHNDGFAENV